MRRNLLLLLNCLVILIFFSVSVHAINDDPNIVEGIKNLDDKITDYSIVGVPKCYENGAVEIWMKHNKVGTVNFDNFIKTVAAHHYKENETIDLKRYWYDQEGSWYDDKYHHRTSSFNKDEVGVFMSEEYLLNREGRYSLMLSGVPYDVIHLIPGARTYNINFTCPGYLHSCKINPSIYDCYSDKKNFYLYLEGIGYENYSQVDMERDVEYQLNYQNYLGSENTFTEVPDTAKYYKEGNMGVIKIPLEDLSDPVLTARIHVEGCNDDFHETYAYSSCDFRENGEKKVVVEKKEQEKKKTVYQLEEKVSDPFLKNNTNVIEQEEPDYKTVLSFLYDLVPLEQSCIKEFLIGLGTY